jgi:hypothetical protein
MEDPEITDYSVDSQGDGTALAFARVNGKPISQFVPDGMPEDKIKEALLAYFENLPSV